MGWGGRVNARREACRHEGRLRGLEIGGVEILVDWGSYPMRHSHVAVFIHYVWATWDRLPLLTDKVERVVYRQIGDKCAALGADLIALGGVEDHVHLLVQAPATISIADFMNHVKGASSHLATHGVLHGEEFFKWQGSYGAFSVSPRHRDAVVQYIKRQREHHAAGTLIAAYEPDAFSPRRVDQHDRGAGV